MNLNLKILAMLHRSYEPSSVVQLQSGRFILFVTTDAEGLPVQVNITSPDPNKRAGDEWYHREPVMDQDGLVTKYRWNRVEKGGY